MMNTWKQARYSGRQYQAQSSSGDQRSRTRSGGDPSWPQAAARSYDCAIAEGEQPELRASATGRDVALPVRIALH